jgi:hypothetical protein
MLKYYDIFVMGECRSEKHTHLPLNFVYEFSFVTKVVIIHKQCRKNDDNP